MTLRRRLIAVLVASVALGLTLFSVVSYQLYSRIQYSQLNEQLHSASPLLAQFIGRNYEPGGPGQAVLIERYTRVALSQPGAAFPQHLVASLHNPGNGQNILVNRVTVVDSGCCGMAGSFGYEHYDLSMAIGEPGITNLRSLRISSLIQPHPRHS